MASLNNLTDQELREKLKEHGINTPVTATTRNILLKKLNHLLLKPQNEQSPSSKISVKGKTGRRAKTEKSSRPNVYNYKNKKTSSLNNFSSDDDDTENDSDQEIQKPSMPQTRSRRSQRKSILDSYMGNSTHSTSIQDDTAHTSFTKSTPIIHKKSKTSYFPSLMNYQDSPSSSVYLSETSNYQYDTGSDSDLHTADEKDSKKISRSFLRDSLSSNKNIFKDYSKRKVSQTSSFDLGSRISNSFRTHLSNGNDSREEVEITSPDDVVSQDSFITPNSQLVNGKNSFKTIRKGQIENSTLDANNAWLSSVPILLLILFALFFCILGCCYLSINAPLFPTIVFPSFNIMNWMPNLFKRMSPMYAINGKVSDESDSPVISTNEEIKMPSKFPICTPDETIKISCLSRSEAEGIPDLLLLLEKTLMPSLLQQAKAYQCGQSSSYFLDTESLATVIKNEIFSKAKSEIVTGLHGLAKLTRLHPNLGIDSVWEDEESMTLRGLALRNPPTEFWCHFTAVFYSLLRFSFIIVLVFFAFRIILQLFRHFKKQNEELEQKSFELVEQILEILENSCGVEGEEFMAVNHVRDSLIPPRERKSKSHFWDKAVAFIDNHDSRVYREVRSVGGEDAEVWRWVSGAPKTPPEKQWQGQAFESIESTQNVPQISPTSCLKIRNMFDCDIEFGDSWPRRIQDCLLEKCENVDIVHVAVDRTSKEGCVYVKCTSAEEAGKAFRSLHGWWFDGNLITVKYLRDERYHERFPMAISAASPMKPSNNERLSLQTEPEATTVIVDTPPQKQKQQQHYYSTRKRSSATRTNTRSYKS